jgi:hypothetical protein
VSTWAGLEERFHKYFYNGETELKLSDLAAVRKKIISKLWLNTLNILEKRGISAIA